MHSHPYNLIKPTSPKQIDKISLKCLIFSRKQSKSGEIYNSTRQKVPLDNRRKTLKNKSFNKMTKSVMFPKISRKLPSTTKTKFPSSSKYSFCSKMHFSKVSILPKLQKVSNKNNHLLSNLKPSRFVDHKVQNFGQSIAFLFPKLIIEPFKKKVLIQQTSKKINFCFDYSEKQQKTKLTTSSFGFNSKLMIQKKINMKNRFSLQFTNILNKTKTRMANLNKTNKNLVLKVKEKLKKVNTNKSKISEDSKDQIDFRLYSSSKLLLYVKQFIEEHKLVAFQYLYEHIFEKMEASEIISWKTAFSSRKMFYCTDTFVILRKKKFEEKFFGLISDYCGTHFLNPNQFILSGVVDQMNI